MKRVFIAILNIGIYLQVNAQTPILEFAHPFTSGVSEGWDDGVWSIYSYNDTLVVSGTLKIGSEIGINGDNFILDGYDETDLGVSLIYNEDDELVNVIKIGALISGFSVDDNYNKYFMGVLLEPQDFNLNGSNSLIVDPSIFTTNFFASFSSALNLNWLRYGRFSARSYCQTSDKTIAVGNYGAGNQIFGISDTLTFNEDNNGNDAFSLAIDETGSIPTHMLYAGESNEIFFSSNYSSHLDELALCGRLSGPGSFQWTGDVDVSWEYLGDAPTVLTYNSDLILTYSITLENQSTGALGRPPRAQYDQNGNLYFGSTLNEGEYKLKINGNEFEFSVDNEFELVIIKFSQEKELQWMKSMAHPNGAGGFENIEIDHNGFVNVCGYFDESLEFIGELFTLTGQYEAGFLARWTPEGELVWAHTINDGGINNIKDICITPHNEMYIGGEFSSFSTDFDFTEDGSFDIGAATGLKDAFLAKYTIANPNPDVFVEQGWQTTQVVEGGEGDVIYVRLSHAPTAPVQVTVTPNFQLDLGNGPGVAVTLNFAADATAVSQQTITVSAFDDITVENLHSGLISFSITSSDTEFNGLTENSISVSVTDNDIVGINELDNTLFTISPNPATNELFVSFTSNQSNTWMQIYDETGRLVMTEQVTAPQHRLDISTLATGTYTIAIQSQNQKQTRLFVKQ